TTGIASTFVTKIYALDLQMKNQPKDVIEEKLNNELKLRFRMMQTILKSEVNVSPFIDQQRLNTLNPPENLRIAIEKFGWKKKTITA
ncbi:hypothetical protein MMR88_23420, partial [Escherichia coli]|nr:hypothetical protein [Escherichia coli]